MDELLQKWPDLVVNILGVILGGLVAYWLARWQFKHQDRKKKKEELTFLAPIYEKLLIEVRDNRNMVNELITGVDNSHLNPSENEWKYFAAIGECFSFHYYYEINRLNLITHLPQDIREEVDNAFAFTKDLQNYINKNYTLHNALRSVPNPTMQLNVPANNLRVYTDIVKDRLDYSVKTLYAHKI